MSSPSAVAAAKVSLGVACVVLALKFVAWRLTGSVALYSDALESIVNVIAAGAAVFALTVAARPADEDHPWGHEKAEYFSAGAEGVLILLAAVLTIREAAQRLGAPQPIESPGLGSLVSLAASSLNAALGFWLLRRGRKFGSPALVADGQHVLSDVYTSAGVLLGIGLVVVTGLPWLDPLLAMFVAVNILFAGWKLVRNATAGLMDEAVPADELTTIAATATKGLPSGVRVDILRARRKGPHVAVELRLVVPGDMCVRDSHQICDAIEGSLRAEGADAVIHVEPG